MGRITTSVAVSNLVQPHHEIRCEALVDTGSAGLVLPAAWKDRLGPLPLTRTVELETADQRVVTGEICGPVRIEIEGFPGVASEVTFRVMQPENGGYEPLLGYIILKQAQVAVDLVGHRLIAVKHADLK
jgi:predicted aspartyl protease